MVIRLHAVLWLLLFPFRVFSQGLAPDPDWRFENFNDQNHFISREVANLTLDKQGYLWTAAIGVQRFDGFSLVDHKSFAGRAGDLKSNYTDVITDYSGRIWVSSAGLCYYNSLTGKFIYVEPKDRPKLTYAYAFCTQGKNLWFISDYGLTELNLVTLKMSFTAVKNITDPIATSLLDDHTLLITSRLDAYLYNIEKKSFITKKLFYNKSLVHIIGIAKNVKGIYLGTTSGIFLVNNFSKLQLPAKPVCEVPCEDLLFMPQDKEKRYLFSAAYANGLLVYDTFLNKVTTRYTHDVNNPYSIINDAINRLYVDAKQRLWMATDRGVSMLDLGSQQWKMRFIDKSSPYEHRVERMITDRFDSTKVWMACGNKGMVYMDWKTKEVLTAFNNGPYLNRIGDFAQTGRNKFILLHATGLIEWDITSKKKLAPIAIPVPDSISIDNYCNKLIKADSVTYFITSSKGLYKYSLLTHKITNAIADNCSLKYDGLLNGFCDGPMLWIARAQGGLLGYTIATGAHQLYNDTHLTDCNFFTATEAPSEQVVCPAQVGLAVFNKRTHTFTHIYTIANLTKLNCIAAICLKNTVWVNTDAGILTYDLKTRKSAVVEYLSQKPDIYPRSGFSRIGNNIIYGCATGYAYFTPDLKNIQFPSDPVIEDFSVNNQPAPYAQASSKGGQKLIFDHQDNSIHIAFTAFLYSNPNGVKFRYRLTGAENQWQYPSEQRNANYPQLKPGNYTFLVQSGNDNDVWNKHTTSVSFVIIPPYWETWWFRALVITVVASSLYSIYQYKVKHLKAIEGLRQGIASDFHDDLGSTLSSISIFSEVARNKAETDLPAAKSLVDDIGLRARSMVQSMNDMVWTIKPENDTLYMLLQRMEEFAYPVAEAKEVQLQFFMSENLYGIKTDMLKRKALFLIFKEAFNNAIKYSNANNIEVRFTRGTKKIVSMQVSDNGCGFDPDKIKPGNGLINMRKRAAEINATLQINKSAAGGCSVTIICKIA